MAWEEIVKANGRPFKEREDYDSDVEFEKNRKEDEERLRSIEHSDKDTETKKKVVLGLYKWRKLAVERKLAKEEAGKEAGKPYPIDETHCWYEEIEKEEKRRFTKEFIAEQNYLRTQTLKNSCTKEYKYWRILNTKDSFQVLIFGNYEPKSTEKPKVFRAQEYRDDLLKTTSEEYRTGREADVGDLGEYETDDDNEDNESDEDNEKTLFEEALDEYLSYSDGNDSDF